MMAPSLKILVWRRLVSLRLLDAWEERLAFVPRTQFVINYLPGGKSARIDIYLHKEDMGKSLIKQFGGEIRVVRQNS
ncbi:MAG: hypothetical protein AAF984_01615, partial [Verrucomicrobiota bacterium]